MDFLKIINAHIMWKQKLQAYIQGTSPEHLDASVIARDDQCMMGQWIYGEGKLFEGTPPYEQVRSEHARFHQLAAEVVRHVDHGDRDQAVTLLHGDYAKISQVLKRGIIALSNELKDREREK